MELSKTDINNLLCPGKFSIILAYEVLSITFLVSKLPTSLYTRLVYVYTQAL